MRGAAFVLMTAMVANVMFASHRQVIPLNFGWEYTGVDSETRIVDLPHDFQISQPWVAPEASEKADASDGAANRRSRLSSRGFKEMGQGKYLLHYTPDSTLTGKRLMLEFGGIMLVGDVYIDGRHVGGTDYGYVPFGIDVTDHLAVGHESEIMVIADTGAPDNSRWYTGGGLFRGVNLIATPADLYFNRHPIHVQVSDIDAHHATVAITADINARKPHKEFRAAIYLRDPDGNAILSDTVDVPVISRWRNRPYDLYTCSIENPRLWDCETPALYTAEVTLIRADGTAADTYDQTFGVRTIEFTPEHGFLLNGRKVMLKGIANHSEFGALGSAAFPRAEEKRIQMLKEFGFNHIRTSHNPYSEEFYDLCDRYGIIVVDELYDKWLDRYTGGRAPWQLLWQRDIPEWVSAHRNHPSVVMWSLGNELQGYSDLPYNDWGVTAYRLQKTLLDKYDRTRPVTVAMHPRYRSLEGDSLPAPLVHETDIAAYNYRYMYFPGDGEKFPHMVFYQSEANLANMGPNYYEPDSAKVVGLAYWGMIDYLGESQGWPAKGWNNGVFDISLEPKAQAWMVKAMFTDTPVVHIGVVTPKDKPSLWNGVEMPGEEVTHYWNLNEGDIVKIYTYTNAEEVELRLNGHTLGRRINDKTDPRSRGRIVWDSIPYRAGRLEAVAYTAGREVSRHEIRTAGKPTRLVVEADHDGWKSDGMDLQHVRVYAVDRKGVRCPQADDEVRFEITGDATILATASGDITSDEIHTTPVRRLWQGGAQAIVRAGRTPGKVILKVSSDNYPPVKVELRTVSPR